MAYLTKKLSMRLMLLLLFAAITAVPSGCVSKEAPQLATEYQGTEIAPDSTLITGISAAEDDQGTIVTISGNRMLTFTSVKQADPVGVVFYFPNTGLGPAMAQLTSSKGVVSGIESAELVTDNTTVRVAIHLTNESIYTVNQGETELEVIFPAAATTVTKDASAAPKAVAAGAEDPLGQAEASLSQDPLDADPATMISAVSSETADRNALIRIAANGIIQDYTSFTLTDPPRIVYDLNDIQSPYDNEQTLAADNPWVERVRYYTHPDKVRLVIETTVENLSKYSATPTQSGLTIAVGGPASSAPVYLAAAEQVSDVTISQPEATTVGWVNEIDFTSDPTDGKSTILIGATETPEYIIEKSADNQLTLTLFNTKLPDYRERPLITTGFESAVDRVVPYTDTSAPDETFFTIELRESVPYYVEQQGNSLMVHFEASSIPPKPPAAELTLADQQVVIENAPTTTQPKANVTPKVETTKATTTQKTISQAAVKAAEPDTPIYTGEKITFDFYEADVKTVFRIIQPYSGMNFAIDKDVNGQVTLSFDEPVPWDQVLDLVLKMNQLGKVMEGNIVRIATLDTLKREESERQALLLAEQKSKEQELALEPIRTEYIPVNYSNARSEILPHIQTILTSGRGKANVDERSNLIVITDTDRVINEAKAIVQRLDQVTPQVIIEARVVEVNSDMSNELGIQWGVSDAGSTPSFGNGTIVDWNLAMNYPVASTSGAGFTFSNIAGSSVVLDAQLNALETMSKGKVISAPKIVTLDNKKATIKQGQEIGYYERDDSGGSSTAFKDVDLLLEVTPHVTPDNRVSMTVYITKNDIKGTFNNAPLLSTNEAETEFLVNDGETVVIGGILKKTETYGEEGFPVLKDFPGLKWLFSNKSTQTINQELLIFITPKIVTLAQKPIE